MDNEGKKSSKLTPSKCKSEGHRETASSSCSKKLVRKAKLSLQKSHKRGRRNLIKTLTEADLNDTDDFKSGQTFTAGHKTNRQKTDTQNSYRSEQTLTAGNETKRQNNCTSGQTSKTGHTADRQNDVINGQTFTNQQKTSLSSTDGSGPASDAGSECTGVLTACPACGQNFSKDSLTDHLKTCFQQFAHRCGGHVTSSCTTQGTVMKQKSERSEELTLCQLCQKDITNLNSERRTRHLNKCIDQAEAAKWEAEEERKMLEKAKTAILDCPLCGKSLKTEAVRRSHLKKCAHTLGIPLHQMMQSVKQQDEQHQLQLAAGVVPDTIRNRLTRKKSANDKKKTGKRIKSNLDEDLQLAMVLSSSMTDQQTMDKLHGTAYSNTGPADGKKRKNKKDLAELPLLLTLSKEEADNRIANRVTELLIPQEQDEDIALTPPMEASRLTQLAAVSVFTSFMANNRDMIWDKTGLVSSIDDPAKITSLYYTRALMPPVEVSSVPAGSKLSRLSEIPGWLISTNKASEQQSTEQSVSEQMSEHQVSGINPEDLVVSTQTAAVLAELAADNSYSAHRVSTEYLSQASGFCPQEVQIEAQSDGKNLSTSFIQLVNSPDFSDVTIVAKDNCCLSAHKIFLSARCPKLLQMIRTDNTVDLSQVSGEAVLCILKYVYAGTVALTRECFTQVLDLAQQLELQEYYQLCKELEIQMGETQTDQGEEGHHDHDAGNPVWSSSDSEPVDGGMSRQDDGVIEEEYQEIQASQLKRISSLRSSSRNEMLVSGNEEKVKEDDSYFEAEAGAKTKSVDLSSENLKEDKADFTPRTQLSVASGVEREKTTDSSEDLFSDEETEDLPMPSQDSADKHTVTKEESQKTETVSYVIYSESSSPSHGSDYKHENLSNDVQDKENLYTVSSGESDEEGISAKQVKHIMTKIQNSSNNSSSSNHQASSSGKNNLQVDSVLSELANDESFTDHVDESVSGFERSMNKSHEKDQDMLNESDQELNIGNKRSEKGINRLSDESRKRKTSYSDVFPQISGNSSHSDSKTLGDLERKEPNSKRYKVSTPVSAGQIESLGLAMDDVSKIEYCSPITETKKKDCPSDQLEKYGKSRVIADDSLFISPAVKKYLRSTFMLATPASDNKDNKTSVIRHHNEKCESSVMEKNSEQGVCSSPYKKIKVITEGPSASSLTLISDGVKKCPDQQLKERSIELPVGGKIIESGSDESSDSDVEIVGDNLDTISQKKRSSPKFSSRTIRNRLTQSQTSCEQDITATTYNQSNTDQELSKSSGSFKNSPPSVGNKISMSVAQKSPPGVRTHEKQDPSATQSDAMSADSNPDDDVWEGFDAIDPCPGELFADFGADADVESSPEKKVRSQKKKRVPSGSKVILSTPSCPLSSPKQTSQITECESDILMDEHCIFEEDLNIETIEMESKFKTPKTKQPGKTKIWMPPSPFTPMQDYDNMVTPQLKKAVERYGLKPMCKKRMKLILKDIYKQTHQYETDSDYEPDTIPEETCQIRQENPTKIVNQVIKTKTARKVEKETDSKTTQMKKTARKTKTNVVQKNTDLHLPSQSQAARSLVPQKMTDQQSEELSISSSQESTNSDMPEESFLIEDEELSASQQTDKPELHAQLMKFVMNNTEIHTKILIYEPLELDWLKLKVTEGGIKCSIQKLMDFLDEKCITFTMKNMSKRHSRRKPTRRKKAASVKLAI